MRRLLKVTGLTLALLAGLGLWKRDELRRLQAVLTLFDDHRIVGNFSAMNRAFLARDLPVSATPLPLPQGPAMPAPDGLEAWMQRRAVTALVVLKNGQIVAETYRLGTGATDLRISWSVAKSFLSALFGIVLAEGAIRSIDDGVTDYAPALRGTAYDGATVRDVLMMSSGVAFNEDYMDFNSDINKMGRVLALGKSMDTFAAGVNDRARAPGSAWQYVSIDTHVIGMVIRGATGRGIVDLMSEKLLMPLGLEAVPHYVTDGLGEPFVLGGLNLRTRDYARFGLMMAQGGQMAGRQIVPADWVAASTRRQANTPAGQTGYGYQWWVPESAPDGEFMARGIYGQFIYVNRAAGVVIAVNSADRRFTEAGVEAENIAMFRSIAAAE